MVDLGTGGLKEAELMNQSIDRRLKFLERELIRKEEVSRIHENADTLSNLMIEKYGIDSRDHRSVSNMLRHAYDVYLGDLIPTLEGLKKSPDIQYSVSEITTAEFSAFYFPDKEKSLKKGEEMRVANVY